MFLLGGVVGALIGLFILSKLRGSIPVSALAIIVVLGLGGAGFLLFGDKVGGFERGFMSACKRTCQKDSTAVDCQKYCECGLSYTYNGRKKSVVVALYAAAKKEGKGFPDGEQERMEDAMPTCRDLAR